MESANELKMTDRLVALKQWLRAQQGIRLLNMHPMPGDASLRRYFRIETDVGTFVAMDAPPPQEDCRPFTAIGGALRSLGLQAPEIHAADVERGFLLLTDFGDQTYLKALQANNADRLYDLALESLAVMQGCRDIRSWQLPLFTHEWMWREWEWHKEWFLNKLLGLSVSGALEQSLNQCFALIVESASSQPQVFMHRDYHSANLMVLPKQGVGILDFQDAFIGPVTYDLVSLLRDCYIDWPDEQVTSWVQLYLHKLQARRLLQHVDERMFMHWFDWMGIERHLKALFTFARKHVRDHQPDYLKHIPRTLDYIMRVSQRYPELDALHSYMTGTVHPAMMEKLPCVP